MSLRTLATLALATGLAVAKPISAPQSKRNNDGFGGKNFNAVINGFNGNGYNFIDGFNKFNQQQQVIQIQEQNLQIINNGFQQQVVQQVNEVLIVDQVNNGFNNDLNNVFRKSNFQNQFKEVSTVMLVVQEIQISVDNGFGGQFEQQVFAQSVQIANRGRDQTQTLMVFDARTLVAQDILQNNAFQNINAFGGIAGATAAFEASVPTKTAGIQLFGAKPTWSSIAEDPAASLGGIWQGALQDLQANENDGKDNELNAQIAVEEKKKLDEANAAEEEKKKQDEANAAEEEKKKQDEANAAEEEKKKQDEANAAAEEEKKKMDEANAALNVTVKA